MMDKGGMGRSKVCCRRAGGVAMGAPQIADAAAAWTTSRERILPVMCGCLSQHWGGVGVVMCSLVAVNGMWRVWETM